MITVFNNTQQINALYRPAVNYGDRANVNPSPLLWEWRRDNTGFVFAGIVLFLAVMFVRRGQAVFRYFNF